MLQKNKFQINTVSLNFLFIEEPWKKLYHSLQKDMLSNDFNIDDNKNH